MSRDEDVPDDPMCSECKCRCGVDRIDCGIGSYEFWGQRGNDSQECAVSDCCEAPLEPWCEPDEEEE